MSDNLSVQRPARSAPRTRRRVAGRPQPKRGDLDHPEGHFTASGCSGHFRDELHGRRGRFRLESALWLWTGRQAGGSSRTLHRRCCAWSLWNRRPRTRRPGRAGLRQSGAARALARPACRPDGDHRAAPRRVSPGDCLVELRPAHRHHHPRDLRVGTLGGNHVDAPVCVPRAAVVLVPPGQDVSVMDAEPTDDRSVVDVAPPMREQLAAGRVGERGSAGRSGC